MKKIKNNFFQSNDEEKKHLNDGNGQNSSIKKSSQKNESEEAHQISHMSKDKIENKNNNILKGDWFYIKSKKENIMTQKKEVNKEKTEKKEEIISEKDEEMNQYYLSDYFDLDRNKFYEDIIKDNDVEVFNSTEKNSESYNNYKIENEYSHESNNCTEMNLNNKTEMLIIYPKNNNQENRE